MVDARQNLAVTLARRGDLNGAAEEFRDVVRARPNSDEAHYNLGRVLLQLKNDKAALAEFEKAVGLKPHYPQAMNNLALLLERTGDREAALKEFRALIAISPHYVEALNNFGQLLADTGQVDEAIKQFQSAIRIRPEFPQAHENPGLALLYEPGILSPQGFLLGNDFRSWYHGWSTQVTKRMSHGLEVVASYTLSKSIDTSSTDNLGATVSDPFNLRTERGRSSWDRLNAFVASWVWSPETHFAQPGKNKVLGSWTLTGITSLQSGTPVTFTSGEDVAADGTFGSQHAQLNGQPIGISHSSRAGMINEFFNTGAFVNPTCSFTPDPGNPLAIEQQNCTPFNIKYSMLDSTGMQADPF